MKLFSNGLRIPASARLVEVLIARALLTPYEHLDGYMLRYWLVKPSRWTRWLGVRVHCILRSDLDRDMHTHPWWNITWVLRNPYQELMPAKRGDPDAILGGFANLDEPFRIRDRKPGALVFRRADSRHKLLLHNGPVWTLFIHGRGNQDGDWGYYVPSLGRVVDRRLYRPRGAQE
ncbi:MAG: hypothetical protein HYX47_10380 [Burkholderiales bacterium]|nr:hypothetical protein [Burkholderiales bacterium]